MTPVTDPTILKQLNGSGGGLSPVTDQAVLAQLNGPPAAPQSATEAASAFLAKKPGWKYGSVLPVANDEAGNPHFALPDIIREPIQSALTSANKLEHGEVPQVNDYMPAVLSTVGAGIRAPATATAKAAPATIASTFAPKASAPEQKAAQLVTRAFQRDKVDPANAAQVIGRYPDKDIAVMDAGGANVSRLARTVRTLPGEGSNRLETFLTERQNDQHNRVLNDITTNFANGADVHTLSDKLMTDRATVSKPLYEEAFSHNDNISSPDIDAILKTDAGQKALAAARVKMSNDRATTGAVDEAQSGEIAQSSGAPRAPAAEKQGDIYAAIRKLGGIKTHTNANHLTPEGGDVREALKDVRTTGLINNKTGFPPDVMHGLLERQGWFGRNGSQDLNELYSALREGKDFQHPEAAGASDSAEANARHLDETRSLADEMGVRYEPHWTAQQIEDAANGAERSAVGLDGQAPGRNLRTLDYVKRSLDDQIGAAQRGGERDNARILTKLKSDFVTALDAADTSGLYKKARAAYSGPSQSLDAIEGGKDFLKMDPHTLAKTVKDLPASDRDFFRVGAARALQDKIGSAQDNADVVPRVFGNKTIRAQIAAVFGTEAATKFAEAAGAEKMATATNRTVRGGSDTTAKLADIADTNTIGRDAAHGFVTGGLKGAIALPALNYAHSKIDAYFHGMTPEVRAALAELLQRSGPSALSDLGRANLPPRRLNNGATPKALSGTALSAFLSPPSEANRQRR